MQVSSFASNLEVRLLCKEHNWELSCHTVNLSLLQRGLGRAFARMERERSQKRFKIWGSYERETK